MKSIRITDSSHALYPTFHALYSVSFPIFEQRTVSQQDYAFGCENYHLNVYYENETLIGFISYWEFNDYIYVEHFTINDQIRGKGHGSRILHTFIQSSSKTILLEIAPVTNEVAKARLRFYERCGFVQNPYAHKHPSCRTEYQPHDLSCTYFGPIHYRRRISPVCFRFIYHSDVPRLNRTAEQAQNDRYKFYKKISPS